MQTELSDERVHELLEMAEKATPEPWSTRGLSDHIRVEHKTVVGKINVARCGSSKPSRSEPTIAEVHANAELTAAYRSALPLLAREVLELRRENARKASLLLDWEEREAAICPEDVGFEELIGVLRRELKALREREGWVRVSPETMPPTDRPVLRYSSRGIFDIEMWWGNKFHWANDIIYWRPLPAAPDPAPVEEGR